MTFLVDSAPKQPVPMTLTGAEEEVLRLIREEFLTPKQIQIRRQCTKQAYYKIFTSLKRKGALNPGLPLVDQTEAPVNQVNQRLVRLHGQEFHLDILFQDHRYQQHLVRSNIFFLKGHTIKLYRNGIEIYAGKGISFYGDDADQAFSKSLEYWKQFFVTLENELSVTLVKPRARNIRIVNQHFARGDSEVAYNAINNKGKIKVFAQEDGKLAFITDDSFGFKEDETVHPQTGKSDRIEIDKQINDWRLNRPPTNSQLAGHILGVSQNLEHYAVHLKSHVASVQLLGKAVAELTQVVKELKSR